MRNLLLASIVTVFAPFVSSGDSTRPEPTLSPDFSAIQRQASRLTTGRGTQGHTESNGGRSVPPPPEVGTRTVYSLDDLAANGAVRMQREYQRTYPLKGKPLAVVPEPVASPEDSVRPQPIRSPDFSAIRREASRLIAERWTQWCAEFNMGRPAPALPEIEIRMIRRADNLLTHAAVRMQRVYPVTDRPVYLIHAIAWSEWWKTDTQHVLVLRKTPKGFESLLHYDGGWYGKGIDFDVVDLGKRYHRQDALRIQDYACGNTMSQTLTRIYRYDDTTDQFVEIFNELTTWLPSAVPMVHRGTLVFEESDAELKDIVIRTQLVDQWNDYAETSCEARFTWDGTKYQGKMNLPGDLQQDVNEYLEHFPR